MSNQTIRPDYYQTDSPYEPIKIIRHYNLEFERANSLKYILRTGVKNKSTEQEDLIKAITYLQLRVDFLEAKKQTIESTLNINDQLTPKIESIKDLIDTLDQPKVIESLKVGDKIRAIDYLYMHGDTANLALIKDKNYIIKDIVRGMNIIVKSEYDKNHYFKLLNLHEFFHVTHIQGVLTKENIQEIRDSNYQEGLNENYH